MISSSTSFCVSVRIGTKFGFRGTRNFKKQYDMFHLLLRFKSASEPLFAIRVFQSKSVQGAIVGLMIQIEYRSKRFAIIKHDQEIKSFYRISSSRTQNTTSQENSLVSSQCYLGTFIHDWRIESIPINNHFDFSQIIKKWVDVIAHTF